MKTLKTNDSYLSKLAVNKSILKEYSTSECARTVYLNDGDEFQIQLFNPETTEIGAEIFIDGEPLSNLIILNPGERMWLERYTDKAKKFKFKVYTVDGDSKEVEKAIAKNGEIEIKFYRKRKPTIINRYHYPETYIYNDIYVEPSRVWYCNSSDITCSSPNASSVNTTLTASCDASVNYCSTLDLCSSSTTGSASNNTRSRKSVDRKLEFEPLKCSFEYGENANIDGSIATYASYDSEADQNLIETGRVAEGSDSGQRFQEVNIDLEIFAFKTEKIKILPYSRKPFTVNDARKLYCPNCGRKLNTKFNFCPYCGQEIE